MNPLYRIAAHLVFLGEDPRSYSFYQSDKGYYAAVKYGGVMDEAYGYTFGESGVCTNHGVFGGLKGEWKSITHSVLSAYYKQNKNTLS